MKVNIDHYFFQQEMINIEEQIIYKMKWNIEIDLLDSKC